MRTYDEIFAIAAGRKDGRDALEALLEPPPPGAEVAAMPDDRWLALFSRHVFSAGFNWKVIEAKWDGFEAAFHGFDLDRCAMMDDDWFDRLLQDTRIVRNGAKIASVRDNAVFLKAIAAQHGSVGRFIAGWPKDDYAGLLALLAKEGSRLGGTTAQYALRFGGADGYVLSRDVVARLIAEGVIDKPPTSKTAMAQVQAAFNEWAAQSGRSLKEISRTLAMSIG